MPFDRAVGLHAKRGLTARRVLLDIAANIFADVL